jgi:lipopolysaccharide/colanic/teichoic acid biosynthesis glycosyltransferase
VGLGAHEREARLQFSVFFYRAALALLVAVALSSLTLYFFFFIQVGRYSMLYGAMGSFIVLIGFLGLLHRWLGRYTYRFILIGPASSLMKSLFFWDYRKQESVRWAPKASKFERVEFLPVVASSQNENLAETFDRYRKFFRENSLCDLVLSDHLNPDDPFCSQVTMAALQSGVRVVPAPEFYSEFFQRYPVEMLPPSWAIHTGFDVNHPIRNFLKRLMDIVLSGALLLVLLPALFLMSILVWVSSRGPVFYVQERRGRFSRNFKMIKFRTMEIDHEGPETTEKTDPRITFVGKLLRPLHLDELPQLVNIFLGDMSFVGPRPESKAIADMARSYSVLYELRHMVRPGLSGLAQIKQGKTGADPEVILEKLSYDLYYIRNHSILLDLWIMFRTIFVLAKRAW